MKKIISLVLVLVLALSITACDNTTDDATGETVPSAEIVIDAEVLKASWKNGELVFVNGERISIPCSVKDFVEASGLEVKNAETICAKTLSANKSESISLINSNTSIKINCTNTTKEDLNIMETTVTQYSFNNTESGNRGILFAGALTTGVVQTDVTAALGDPNKQVDDGKLYYYNGRNDNNKKVELRIGFNSDNLVNSVAYEVSL